MALSRKGKIWLIILAIPVVLILAAVIGAKLYFTSDRLKAIVVPKLEQATGRQVSLGSIGLSIFPALSVQIDSLSVANAKGKDFSTAPFVSLERLTLSVRLAALLKGNLEVSTVILEKPRIFVEINRAGTANYSGLGGPPAAEKEKGTHITVTTENKSGGFLLSNFQINGGTVDYIDRQLNTAIGIHGLNHTMRVEVDPVVNVAKVEGQTSIDNFSYGTVNAPLVSNLRMTLDQQLSFDAAKDVLTIEKGVFSVQDMVMSVSGNVSDVTKVPRLSLTVESDKLNIADLLSIMPREMMKKAEGLKGTGMGRVSLKVTGLVSDSTKPDITGTIAATNASIQYAQLPKPITDINILADFTRTSRKQEFHMEKFSATLGNNPLSAMMTVTNFDDPTIVMDLKASMNLAEVKDYYPLEAGTDLTGKLSASVNIAGRVSTPAAMKASGSMDFQDVTIKTPSSKKPLEKLRGSITFNNQVIESKKMSMTLGKSDLSLSFWLKNYLSFVSTDTKVPKPTANLTLTSTHLYSADIMTDTSAASAGPPRSGEKGREKPKKSGAMLPNMDMDVTASIGTFTMEKFEFTDVRAAMKISGGIITMQNFSMHVFDGSVVTKGTLNLQKPEQPLFDLSLDMTKVDAHAMLPKFSSFGERLYGRMTMNTTVKGALDDTLGLVPQTLNGQGKVQMQNGKLTGMKVNKSIADLLKLPDLENIEYKDWSNSFIIANGRITIKDLKISALDADYIVNGSQGLDGSMDYTMSLVMPPKTSARINVPGFAGEAVNLFKDESGRVRLDFNVGGTSDDPKISLDTKAAQNKAGDLAKQKAAEEAKKAADQLKKKGEDLLKGLFKKK